MGSWNQWTELRPKQFPDDHNTLFHTFIFYQPTTGPIFSAQGIATSYHRGKTTSRLRTTAANNPDTISNVICPVLQEESLLMLFLRQWVFFFSTVKHFENLSGRYSHKTEFGLTGTLWWFFHRLISISSSKAPTVSSLHHCWCESATAAYPLLGWCIIV